MSALSSTLIWHGVLLGLGAAAPIGPVNVQIARRVLRHGFLAGFALGCGAVSVDVFYAILSSFSFMAVASRSAVDIALGVAGGLLLAYLGVLCLRGAWRDLRADPLARDAGMSNGNLPSSAGDQTPSTAAAHPGSLGRSYVTGVLMTLLNPMTLAFWFAAVPGQIPKGDAGALPMICTGVFIGTICWVIFFSGVLWAGGRYRRSWWLAAADAVGGLMLLGFAGLAFLRLVRTHL